MSMPESRPDIMAYAWKPVRDPPQPCDISVYSQGAEQVLKVIRRKHANHLGLGLLHNRVSPKIEDNYYNHLYSNSFSCLDDRRSTSKVSNTKTSLKLCTLSSDQVCTSLVENDRRIPKTEDCDASPPSPEDNEKWENTEEKGIINQGKGIITDDGEKTFLPSSKDEVIVQVYMPSAQKSSVFDKSCYNDVGTATGEESTRRILGGFLKTNSDESEGNTINQGTSKIVPKFQRQEQKDVKSHPTEHHAVSSKYFKKRIGLSIQNEVTKKSCPPGAVGKSISSSTQPVTWKQESLDMMTLQDKKKELMPSEKGINISSLIIVTEQQQVLTSCLTANEIVMLLSYTGNVTQLKEKQSVRKSMASATLPAVAEKVESIILGVHRAAADTSSRSFNQKEWRLICVPLVDASNPHYGWCRKFLLSIMSCNVRKICFDAQELMSIVMVFTQANPVLDVSKWLCLDPRVACWLMDPDDPPCTFCELTTKVQGGKLALLNQAKHKQEKLDRGLLGDICTLNSCMQQLHKWLFQRQLWDLFFQVEMPLVPLLAGMEVVGIKVNQEKFYSASQILKNRTCQLEKMAHLKAGKVFQLNSHVQLRQILFDELKLDQNFQGKKLERTAGQNLKSTSENVLVKLQNTHPLPGIILEYRKFQKLKSTYVDGFLDYVEKDHIRCTWEQTAAASGRLQSTNPNIQNIPKQSISVTVSSDNSKEDTHHTLHMREPFVSRDGYSLISADFQSIELRILAHFSQDELLLKIFCDEDQSDIFVQIACQWMGLSADEVTEEKREKTKRIVYSVVYGAGSEKIAEILGVSQEKARQFTKSFLDKFPGIKLFTQACISQCRKQGFVTSLLHRRRIIKNTGSGNVQQRLHAERQAVNFVIQGSAADICKVAMLCTVRELRQRPHLQARLLIQIHDELLFEVPDDQVTEVKELIKAAMESVAGLEVPPVKLRTPLPVSLSVGKDWGHLIKC